MPQILNNGRHWRERAEEARMVAGTMANPSAQCTMLEIADGYDRMAGQAEVRASNAEALADSLRKFHGLT